MNQKEFPAVLECFVIVRGDCYIVPDRTNPETDDFIIRYFAVCIALRHHERFLGSPTGRSEEGDGEESQFSIASLQSQNSNHPVGIFAR